MKKRLLAALLALCMALAFLPPGMVVADDVEMDSAPVEDINTDSHVATAPVEDIKTDSDAGAETAPMEDIETDSPVETEIAPAEDIETDFPVGPETAPAEDIETTSEGAGIMPLETVDHTPPVVTGIYMNSPGKTVTFGGTLEFTVSTEDESGIDCPEQVALASFFPMGSAFYR